VFVGSKNVPSRFLVSEFRLDTVEGRTCLAEPRDKERAMAHA